MPRGRKPKGDPAAAPGWANRLRQALEEHGLSQATLEDAIGRKQTTISGYVTGQSEPDLATFRRLAEVLGVSPAWLAFGIEVEEKDDALAASVIEAQQHDRLFARTFREVAGMLAEVGFDADLAFVTRLTQKLLRTAKGADSSARAWELISAALDIERKEIADELDALRKRRL